MAALQGNYGRHAITVIVPATVVFELEDKMSLYITREMLHNAAYENERDDTVGFMGQLGQSLARWWQRRRAIAELEAMDDTLLRDMGIYRSDIRRVVNGFNDGDLGLTRAAWGPQNGGYQKQAANTDNRGAVAA